MRKWMIILILVAVLGAAAFVCIKFYEFVFARTITGELLKVERVNQNQAMISAGRPVPAEQLFSFGVAIRGEKGEIHTASSEDRQWSVAQAGQCVEARFFPYPPWDLQAAGTYHNARLIRLFDCPAKGASPQK